MTDEECVAFLQWALPRLGRRWVGCRKVRRRVCRQIGRRVGELGLGSISEYRSLLEHDPGEWPRLDALMVPPEFRDSRADTRDAYRRRQRSLCGVYLA